jgi:sec-independent protein translocase protein TatA
VIPGVPQIGVTELIILLTIFLLFFGAKRIPELAHSLGRGAREFREGASEASDALLEKGEPLGGERSANSENVQAKQKAS